MQKMIVMKQRVLSSQSIKENGLEKEEKMKKRKMPPPWVGGAPHYSPPPDEPSSTMLTSSSAARWRLVGHYAGGNRGAKCEYASTLGMVFLFSFSV